jgi:hypothetical protein
VLPLGARVPAEAALQPAPGVEQRLGRRQHVEGRRRRAALLEVADPQLASRELPLHVRALLQPPPPPPVRQGDCNETTKLGVAKR